MTSKKLNLRIPVEYLERFQSELNEKKEQGEFKAELWDDEIELESGHTLCIKFTCFGEYISHADSETNEEVVTHCKMTIEFDYIDLWDKDLENKLDLTGRHEEYIMNQIRKNVILCGN